MEKVVIIGSGPAGLTAALYTARANLNPLLIDGLQPGGQLTTTTDVENYPGFPEAVTGTDLVDKMRAQAERFGARFISRDVVATDFTSKPLKISLSDKKIIETASIIISTGASPNYLGLESEQKLIGRGVTSCAVCDGAFYRDLPVVVVGGGDSAMEESLFLSRLTSKVTLIHRRDEFRASKIMSARVKENENIDIILNSVVAEVMDVEKNEVTGVRLKNVKTEEITELSISGVFIAIGHRPNTEIFKDQIKMDKKGFIITSNTRTSTEGVFAAGDVQDHIYRQAVTAAGTGCMAALETERYLSALNS